jgi:hypothetical protein
VGSEAQDPTQRLGRAAEPEIKHGE